jgi:hypothetical protein
MRPGTHLVSNSFAVPQQAPGATVEVGDGRTTELFIYPIDDEDPQ